MTKRILFIEMMGVPGSYDGSVYDHFRLKDDEGAWFKERFGHIEGIEIGQTNPCVGEALPDPCDVDGLVLAGSYNSVHDHTDWQQVMRAWLPIVRENKVPTLAICGSHQLASHLYGSDVEKVDGGAFAGTFPVQLTQHGRSSPLFRGIDDLAPFQYANTEHVVGIPEGGILMGSSEKSPVAALDFGDHFYSTQFHPEGTHETLSTVWRFKAPEWMKNYIPEQNGFRLVENFLGIVTNRV